MDIADRSFKKNKDFYIIFGIVLLAYCLSINTDLAEYSEHRDIDIPSNFFYYTIGLDILVIASWLLILFYKKLGVYLFPVFVFVHFVIHLYFLSTFLYSDVMALFLFVGLGLFALIPRWKALK